MTINYAECVTAAADAVGQSEGNQMWVFWLGAGGVVLDAVGGIGECEVCDMTVSVRVNPSMSVGELAELVWLGLGACEVTIESKN